MAQVPESYWRQELGESNSESNGIKWSFASRTLVRLVMVMVMMVMVMVMVMVMMTMVMVMVMMVMMVMVSCFDPILQILHLAEGDTLELRMTEGRAVYLLTLTINLTSPDV